MNFFLPLCLMTFAPHTCVRSLYRRPLLSDDKCVIRCLSDSHKNGIFFLEKKGKLARQSINVWTIFPYFSHFFGCHFVRAAEKSVNNATRISHLGSWHFDCSEPAKPLDVAGPEVSIRYGYLTGNEACYLLLISLPWKSAVLGGWKASADGAPNTAAGRHNAIYQWKCH